MQIKKIASSRAASLSDSDKSLRIPRKKRDEAGVLSSKKSPKRAHSRNHCIQRYCVIYKKSVMPERKYTSHSAKYCTGVHTNRPINYGMEGPMGSSTDAVKHYNKSEHKLKRVLKTLKKQNKIIYSIAKKSGSRRDIKKIRANYSKKTSDCSSDDSDSGSSLSSDSS